MRPARLLSVVQWLVKAGSMPKTAKLLRMGVKMVVASAPQPRPCVDACAAGADARGGARGGKLASAWDWLQIVFLVLLCAQDVRFGSPLTMVAVWTALTLPHGLLLASRRWPAAAARASARLPHCLRRVHVNCVTRVWRAAFCAGLAVWKPGHKVFAQSRSSQLDVVYFLALQVRGRLPGVVGTGCCVAGCPAAVDGLLCFWLPHCRGRAALLPGCPIAVDESLCFWLPH